MEAAPRLPMLSFDLKTCSENTHFAPQLRQYIAAFYNEDPESYQTEIQNLEMLRASAIRSSKDVHGVQLLKKYYCQLHFLKSRFPMEENQDASVQFSWKDSQLDLNHTSNDIRFELMAIMYNIGALHSYLGASDSRSNPDGMKLACTHFQCAAWAFQNVKEKYSQFLIYISTMELVHFFQQVSLAQAQECILEKSMLDNRKPTIIAKVAVQVYSYYRQSLSILEYAGEDLLRDKTYQEWNRYLHFKRAYYKCIALLFQGQQAEEQQKMGERVAYYQAACEQLEEAKKYANMLKNRKPEINEGISFTQDVVEGKRKAAKNENEFIYHEEVPKIDQLEEIKGAALVKGISFSINDSEVSGSDIFARLVPMEAHEAASLYSEKKAQLLRSTGELIESKDQALAEFMSSMQLDILTKIHQATGIPQEIIDRAAALAAKPTATQELQNLMEKLSSISNDVEVSLKEIDNLLKEEEQAEKKYQEIMGKRPPSMIATDLSRECSKYKEAHTKAYDSNQSLQKAMTAHIANLKILQQPLRQLQQQLPAVELPNSNIDENALKQLEGLASKVEEMRNQRAMLWAQLRESVHKDDITNSLVTKQPNQSLEQLFQQELQKHQHLISILEQNTTAQDNIRRALIDAYANAVSSRKYVNDILQKRTSTINALIVSCDTYDDLLSKALKGIEFYTKLETNVSKLLQRIKSACKVQQEEREQMLLNNDVPNMDNIGSLPVAPKLKDFLESRKKNSNANPVVRYTDQNLQYRQQVSNIGYAINPGMELPPGIRPAPLGSEVTDAPKSLNNEPPYSYPTNMQYNYNQVPTGYSPYYQQHPQQSQPQEPTAQPQQPHIAEQELANRMKHLMSNSNTEISVHPQEYTSYIPQNYTPSTTYADQSPTFTSVTPTDVNYPYDGSKVYTTTINSYRPLSSTIPNTSTPNMQYPDSSLRHSGSNEPSSTGQYATYSSSGYTHPSHTSTQSGIQNINTYYPVGYSPHSSGTPNQAAQMFSGQVQYHSLEYATSVQEDIGPKTYNSTYSSPVQNLTSAQARDMNHMSINSNLGTKSQNISGSTTKNIQQGYGYQVGAVADPPSHPNSSYQRTAMVTSHPAGTSGQQSQNIVYPSSSSSYATSYSYPTTTTYTSVSTPYTVASGYSPYPADGGSALYQSGTVGYSGVVYPFGAGNPSAYPVNSTQQSTEYTGSSTAYANGIPAVASQTYPISGTPQSYPPQSSIAISSTGGTADYGGYQVSEVLPYSQGGSTQVPQQTPVSSNNTDPAVYAAHYNQNYWYAYPGYTQDGTSGTTQGVQEPSTSIATPVVPTTTKESNIDLLSGLDFTISQAPLVPQQNVQKKEDQQEHKPSEAQISTNKTPTPSIKEEPTTALAEIKRPNVKILPSKPLNNTDVKNLFSAEIEKYEKYVETLTNKTLSGPTNLDIKWKEIQDKQDSDSQKKIISVARCYPMKNRFPDILPYDHSRIELHGTNDDYINASYVKDVSLYAPCFIVTQAPLSSTFADFWTMIREQQVELIFCLLNDNEIGGDVYWPNEKGQSLHFLNMVITLQSAVIKTHWVERLISVTVPEKRESWMIMHLQFTSWPGSLFPTTPEPFISYIMELITLFQQQRSNSHPVVVHCSSGIGRSGLACLLTTALFDLTNNANSIPDLSALTSKLTNCRKNILRDREHLKFAYECLLAYMKQVVTQDKMKKKLSEVIPKAEPDSPKQPVEIVEKNIDPLSTLDPFWASKK